MYGDLRACCVSSVVTSFGSNEWFKISIKQWSHSLLEFERRPNTPLIVVDITSIHSRPSICLSGDWKQLRTYSLEMVVVHGDLPW